MATILNRLLLRGVISPPQWLTPSVDYLVVMGSEAYGCSLNKSDRDVYGFATPPLKSLFPHLTGSIPGFRPEPKLFEQWQEHHVRDPDRSITWDLTVFNIVKYVDLCAGNNPNMLDSLFVPDRCVLFASDAANHLRANRTMFLSKLCADTFRGYAKHQLLKIRKKTGHNNPVRNESIMKHGYDTKYAMHLVRLMLECKEILLEGNITIDRNASFLKEVRSGCMSLDELEKWFESTDQYLAEAENKSVIPHRPDRNAIRQILAECIEINHGPLPWLQSRYQT